jgi:RND family efflux transporter MFP subunit
MFIFSDLLATICALGVMLFLPGTSRAEQAYECLIEPKIVTRIGSQAFGVLQRIAVDRGDFVKIGDTIAELDSTIETHNVAIARLRAENDSEVRLAEEAATLYGSQFSRRSELWKGRNVSEEVFEKAKSEAFMRKFELERAKYALEQAGLEAKRAQSLLNQRTIKSPIDGVITSRKMSPGEYVRDDSQIVEIAQINPLYVHAFLPVKIFNQIQPGALATVIPEEAVGGRHDSVVTMKDPVIDAASSTFLVRIELPNSSGLIPSGIRCHVTFNGQ